MKMEQTGLLCFICGSAGKPLVSGQLTYGNDKTTMWDCLRAVTGNIDWDDTAYDGENHASFCQRCSKTLQVAYYLRSLGILDEGQTAENGETASVPMETITVSVALDRNEERNGTQADSCDAKYQSFFTNALDRIKFLKCVDSPAASMAVAASAVDDDKDLIDSIMELIECYPSNSDDGNNSNTEVGWKCTNVITSSFDIENFLKNESIRVAPMAAVEEEHDSSGFLDESLGYDIDDTHQACEGSLTDLKDASVIISDASMDYSTTVTNDNQYPMDLDLSNTIVIDPSNVQAFTMNTSNEGAVDTDEGIDCSIYFQIVEPNPPLLGPAESHIAVEVVQPDAIATYCAEEHSIVEEIDESQNFATLESPTIVDNHIEYSTEQPTVMSLDEKESQFTTYKCNECDFTANDLLDLLHHYTIIHGFVSFLTQAQEMEKYTCHACNYTTVNLKHIHAHLVRAHNIKKNSDKHYTTAFACPKCDKKFAKVKWMRIHYTLAHGDSKGLKRISNTVFICEFCDQNFSFKSGLKMHQRSCLHPFRPPIKCDICSDRVEFSSFLKFERHLTDVHCVQLVHRCELCGKDFKTRDFLARHRRRHTERHHQCQICDRNYVNESELRKHMNTHKKKLSTIVKLIQCSTCNAQFTNKLDLQKHRLKVHVFKCKICNEQFDSRYALRAHTYCHTGKPYNCVLCNVWFVRRYNVVRHAKTKHKVDLSDDQLNEMYLRNIGKPNRHYAFAQKDTDLMLLTNAGDEELLADEMQEIGININDLSDIC